MYACTYVEHNDDMYIIMLTSKASFQLCLQPGVAGVRSLGAGRGGTSSKVTTASCAHAYVRSWHMFRAGPAHLTPLRIISYLDTRTSTRN